MHIDRLELAMSFRIIRKTEEQKAELERLRQLLLKELAAHWSETKGDENIESSAKFFEKFALIKSQPQNITEKLNHLRLLIQECDKESLDSMSNVDIKKVLDLLQ